NQAKKTVFGKEHGFAEITSHEEFVKRVPIRDYEALVPYIEKIKAGEKDVLWPGKPVYFAKSSGTTSGVKYIPLTKDSIPNHINSARNALLLYISENSNSEFVNGKMIFLSGSPVLENVNGILTGRLSGIVNHHVPKYLKGNQLPSFATNCIEDWEQKVDAIVEETYDQNMTLISGIPPWVQMYFEKLLQKTGKKTIKEIFPNFNLLIYGGVNFEPYRSQLFNTIGEEIDSIETYPASEGFIAYQDSQKEKGLLLNVDSGIFFEFISTSEVFNENPTRLTIKDIELDVNYALVINSNAGLWGYLIGDTVKFVSKNPYRIVVTGRIKHFISAFGEHVIAEEVESALMELCNEEKVSVTEFTVAPQVNPKQGLPYHEWLIEFSDAPSDIISFRNKLDQLMQQKNIYYKDLITGNILEPLHLTALPKDAFRNYMKSVGKLGGQNKVPRLTNDRNLAEALLHL
ncbi:MAG: GH3 auxin-responsive promoter family protein, partial [Bacteroidota bacterium]